MTLEIQQIKYSILLIKSLIVISYYMINKIFNYLEKNKKKTIKFNNNLIKIRI
jgi:hypothetical protein